MIFITNGGVMDDKNVRLAMCHAVDKETIVKRCCAATACRSTTLEAPEYEAFDPSIKVPYDPALAAKLLGASGYSKEKPVKFTIQTTRGFKPKDYEMIQAIVGMWRNVGIDANIEIYEIAKHFELRMSHKLAPAAFYNWGNAIGDPTTSTGFAMFGKSPHSAWHSDDLDAMIGPLWGEKDEKKRIAGWKDVDRYIAEQGYVLPLLQYAQPILYKSDLKVTPNVSGALQPTLFSKARSRRSGPPPRRGARRQIDEIGFKDRPCCSSPPRQPHGLGARDACRRGRDRVRAAARGARRSGGDDDLAGRGARRHRGAQGALRARCAARHPVLDLVQGVVTGDFGTSITLHRYVTEVLAARLPATLELVTLALLVAVLLGGTIAIIGTLMRRTAGETVIDGLNSIMLAVPDFIWALVLVLLFAVAIPVLPISGRIDPELAEGFSTKFYLAESLLTGRFAVAGNIITHMAMPTFALALPLAAVIVRLLKQSLKEAMVQDYVLLARIKGFGELRLVLQEALRNAVGPTLALTGVQFTFLIGGTVIVERIFSYPGIGNLAIDAVINRDFPLIQGLVLLFGLIFILINIGVDLTVAALNPRLRHG